MGAGGVGTFPSKVVFRKIHEAERMAAAGERELGFYLLEVQRRRLHREKGTSFEQCLLLRTGTSPRKAHELMGISRKLEKLPAIDNAFADGLLYWTAVRAIVTVAKPEDELEWVEFARKNTVRAVEREVATCRRGDGPGKRRWGGSSVRFPHRINATPELHQLIVSWQEVLSKRWERAVTEEEAFEHGLQTAMKVEIQADDDDAREGKVRKLPSGYRLVIHQTPAAGDRGVPGDEGQFWVSLPDGPVRIDAATARRLLEGAEVLDFRSATGPEGLGAVRQRGELAIDDRQKVPHVGSFPSQVVPPQGANLEVPERGLAAVDRPGEEPKEAESEGAAGTVDRPGQAVGAAGAEAIDDRQKVPHVGSFPSQVVAPQGAILEVPHLPLWAKAAPLVPTDPGMRIEHAPNLTIPGGPTVPPEERAPRSSAELIKQVLSREGYFCAIPGCTNMAEIAHHIVFHSQGGPTNLLFLIAVCKTCHDAGIHKGYLLVSGTAGNLIISARDGLPLTAGAEAYPPSVTFEVEPPPCCPEPSGPNLASEADRAADTPALVIPPEIPQAWLLEHRRHFEWSERQKALVLRAARDPVGERAAFEDPVPAPPAAAKGLDGFIGQKAAVNSLKTVLSAAKLRGDVPAPVLLAGPPGLGKTKLAGLAARELGSRLYVSAGPALGDLLALLRFLVSLKRGDVFFIDEIHALPKQMAECLYQALAC